MNPYGNQETYPGYYDLPFIYVFDADGLTDGNNYNNLAVPLINTSDFILRRITGIPNVATRFRYRDERQADRMAALVAVPNDHVVAPELKYGPTAQIAFDLSAVLRANNTYLVGGSVPNYWSQIAFQGVRRFYGQKGYETPYRFYERPYILQNNVAVSWAGRLAPAYQIKNSPVQFNVLVENYDFELQALTILVQKQGESLPATAVAAVKLTIYDALQQQLSSGPVVDLYLNSQNSAYNSVFPVPTTVYPAGGVIRFDVESLLIDTEVPATLSLQFIGVQRYPI